MFPALISRVTCDDVTWDGAELRRRAHGAARALAGASRVAVDEPEPVHRLGWVLGAELAGAAALVVDPDWSRRDEVLADAAPDVVVSGVPEPGEPVAPRGGERTWFYLPTTSGSSGAPKVLVRSRRSWLESFRALDVPLGPDDEVLVPGPLSSSLFLFGALHAVHEGAPLRLLRRWSATAAAEACREAAVVHVVPAMLAALLSVWERAPEPRPRLRLVVCGGAAVDAELEARLHRVVPGCELLEYYGAAELSLVAVRRGEPRLRPVVEVDVRDEDGASLPPGVPGALWARSELVFDGYLRGGEFRPAEPGWCGVGDRAVRHEDGALTVLGRSGAVIGTGGHLVAAEEVEAALRALPGVLDVVLAGTPHRRLGSLVTAVLELDPESPPTRARLRDATRHLEPAKRPRRWLVLPELPRTPAGKPARAEVARLLRDGALDAEVPS